MSDTDTKFIVPAEAWSDDHAIDFRFDAVRWLAEAPVESIVALARCNFRGDYGADQVAHDIVERPEVYGFPVHNDFTRLFAYLEAVNDGDAVRVGLRETVGFEVSVDPDAAMDWLATNRPDTWQMCQTDPFF